MKSNISAPWHEEVTLMTMTMNQDQGRRAQPQLPAMLLAVLLAASTAARAETPINHLSASAVKPSESIQAAIDSLPLEGGIVQLAEGAWNLGCPVRITRSNVTLRGAGIGKTTLTTTEKDLCLVLVSPLEDNDFILHEKTGGTAQQDPRLKNAPLLHNIQVRELSLIGPGTSYRSRVESVSGLVCAKVDHAVISDVEATRLHHGICLFRCNDNTLEDLKITQNDFYMLFFSVSVNNTIRNCRFEKGNRWYGIDFNGHCKGNKVLGCVFKDNGQGDLKLYSGSDGNEILGNVFDGGGKSQLGVVIMNGASNLIQGNLFTRHRKARECAAVVQRSGGGDRPPEHYNHDNRILGNTFYKGQGDAILRLVGGPVEVCNNIIVGYSGGALAGVDPGSCSYNDLWDNAGGNDGGAAGSIAADPLFADPATGDFHLKSRAGRWDPRANNWGKDDVHSPCIDAGGPQADYCAEPQPNGGRVNLGAYGNTPEASKSLSSGK